MEGERVRLDSGTEKGGSSGAAEERMPVVALAEAAYRELARQDGRPRGRHCGARSPGVPFGGYAGHVFPAGLFFG